MYQLNLFDIEDAELFIEELASKERTDFLLDKDLNNEEEDNASN